MNAEGFGGVCNRPVHPFAGTHVQEKADGAEQTQDGDNQTQNPMGIMEADDGFPLLDVQMVVQAADGLVAGEDVLIGQGCVDIVLIGMDGDDVVPVID